MPDYNVTLLASEKEIMDLPYTGSNTVATPCVQSLEGMRATISVPRYCIAGFNLARWHKEFFAGADVPLINDHLTANFLMKLLEIELMEEERKKTQASEDKKPNILDTTGPDAPFIIRVIRARADAIQFPITDAACVFLGCLCNTPGHAVMYTIASACSWQQATCGRLLGIEIEHPEHEVYPAANMSWFLRGHVMNLLTGQEITLKIPSDAYLHRMWELQKIRPANGGSDNALDRLGVIAKDELVKFLDIEAAKQTNN